MSLGALSPLSRDQTGALPEPGQGKQTWFGPCTLWEANGREEKTGERKQNKTYLKFIPGHALLLVGVRAQGQSPSR